MNVPGNNAKSKRAIMGHFNYNAAPLSKDFDCHG